MTAAKLTCPCNRLRASISFARSDSGVVIDSKPQQSHAKQACCFLNRLSVFTRAVSAFPFYTSTKPLIRLHIKYKKGGEYDQDIPKSQTADKPVTS